jgi:hypothetical protein
MFIDKSMDTIHDLIFPMLEKKAWGIKLGYGSFLTIEFGVPVKDEHDESIVYGEWHLWVYCCAWRIEKSGSLLVCSEDAREKIEGTISQMEGCTLKDFKIEKDVPDTTFIFENDLQLRLFIIYSEEYEHWKLFMPGDETIVCGPGTSFSVK